MVSTETLQVIINAKDMLSDKIRQVNNAINQTGSVANSSSAQATSATSRMGSAYDALKTRVSNAFNSIKNTIRNSTAVQTINESRLAQPFLNAAEKIKSKWQTTMQQIKSATGVLSNMNVGTGQISNAGLATLNGQIASTTSKTSLLGNALIKVGNVVNTVGTKGKTAFTNFQTGISNAKNKLTNLAMGLSGVQSAIMSAFAVVGVTSLKSFIIDSAIAREKVNAVTQSVTGSAEAFKKAQSSIKSAVAGTTLGYNNMATAVNNVALRFHVAGDAVSKLPGPMAKVGIMAQAMGKSSQEAASIMEHAFDGLQGKWRSLKQIGITEADLKAAGWSGAANDIEGYAAALDKVLEKNPKFKEFTNTFEYQWESFKMSIKGVGTEIGMFLLPILKTVLGWISDLSKQHPWLLKIAVVIGVVVLALSSIATVILPIIQLIEAIKTITAVTAIWNAVLALNPITIIVVAIVALIAVLVYLYYTNEDVRNAVDGFVQFIQTSVIGAWNSLCEAIGNAWNWLVGIGEYINGVFMSAWTSFWEFINSIILIFQNFGSYLELLYNNFMLWLGSIILYLWNWATSLYNTFIVTASNAVTGFVLWIASLPGQVWAWLMVVLQNVWNWGQQVVSNFITTATNAVNGFIKWVSSLPGKFWTWLLNTLNKINTWRSQIVDKMKETAKKMVDDFIEWIKKLPSKFGEWLSKIKNEISSRRGALVSAIIKLGWDLLNDFKNALLGGITGSADVGDAITYQIKGMAQTYLDNSYRVADAMTVIGESAVEAFNRTGANNMVANAISSAKNEIGYHVSSTLQDETRIRNNENKILGEIRDYLTGSEPVEIVNTGTVEVKYALDINGLPDGVDEERVSQLVSEALTNKEVIKQIVTSPTFQRFDERTKNKLLNELRRHI